jgi:hypothetical protein
MSRSNRRPYAAITGASSAKDDKCMAHRGVRRKQDIALKTCADYEDFLVPHRLECAWNNTYCWDRDGAQMDCSRLRYSKDARDKKYYRKLLRK